MHLWAAPFPAKSWQAFIIGMGLLSYHFALSNPDRLKDSILSYTNGPTPTSPSENVPPCNLDPVGLLKKSPSEDLIKATAPIQKLLIISKTEKALIASTYQKILASQEGLNPETKLALKDLLDEVFIQINRAKVNLKKEELQTVVVGTPPLTARIWNRPDGQIIIDLPDFLVGVGAAKKVHLAIDYNETAKTQRPHLLTTWDISLIGRPERREWIHNEIEVSNRFLPKSDQIHSVRFLKDHGVDSLLASQVFFDLKNLADYRSSSPVTEDSLTAMSSQLLHGLKSIHDQGFYHGDIKSKNILVRSAEKPSGDLIVRIADFGLSKNMSEVKTRAEAKKGSFEFDFSIYGTAQYTAPELGKLTEKDHPHSTETDIFKILKRADIWAMGMSLYDLESKKNSTQPNLKHEGCAGTSAMSIAMKVTEIETYNDLCRTCRVFCSKEDPTLSQEPPLHTIDHVIYRMLNPNPHLRISAEDSLSEIEALRQEHSHPQQK